MEENREKKEKYFNAFVSAIHILMPIYLSPPPLFLRAMKLSGEARLVL
jgi:hypothetical protein